MKITQFSKFKGYLYQNTRTMTKKGVKINTA